MAIFAPSNQRPNAGVTLPRMPCPLCGDIMVMRRDGRAIYWHHRPVEPPCSYVSIRLSPRGFMPGEPEPPVLPRRKADPIYAWKLNHQLDFQGHDSADDLAREKFKRKGETHPGRIEPPMVRRK